MVDTGWVIYAVVIATGVFKLSSLLKLLYLMDKSIRRKSIFAITMYFFLAIFEVVGVVSVIPVVSLLSTPEIIYEGGLIGQIYKFFVTIGFGGQTEFFVLVCFGSASLLIAGTTIKILAILSLNRFVEWTRHELSTTLIELTLSKSYQASMNQHSSETADLVISEADKFISDVLRPTIVFDQQLNRGLTFYCMSGGLRPKVALGIFLVLAAIFAVPLLGLTGLLKEVGEQRLRANNEKNTSFF